MSEKQRRKNKMIKMEYIPELMTYEINENLENGRFYVIDNNNDLVDIFDTKDEAESAVDTYTKQDKAHDLIMPTLVGELESVINETIWRSIDKTVEMLEKK
jgi:hypothetical protein